MKRIIPIFITFILSLAFFCVPVSAAGTGTLSFFNTEGKQGDTVTVNISLNSNPGLITMKFDVSWDEDLELTNVSNLGLLAGWTTPSPTISYPYTLRWADSLATTNNTATGKIATLTFKIKDTATIGNKIIALTFSESRDSNGGKNTFNNATATIKVTCKTHDYGNYSKQNDTTHTRTCFVCNNVETKAHTWNNGSVTKTANCKESGNTRYTCTAAGCDAIKDVAIAKTNSHTFGAWSQISSPKCTTVGKDQRTCSTCQKVETRDVAAIGHNYDDAYDTDCNTCGETRVVKKGWINENGKWAYYENGVMLKDCWKEDSTGWCYLGSDGYMRTNAWIMDSQGWCYVGADGYCVTNAWIKDSYGWCYLNSEGRMATNSWIMDSQGWCYVGADGYCVTNAWMKDSVGWCYLNAEGRMATNCWVMDSVGWCYVGADGYAVTNCWKQDSVGWCYLNSEGSMTKSAWVYDGGWYYLDGNGYMLFNTSRYIGGKVYNFNYSGLCTNP